MKQLKIIVKDMSNVTNETSTLVLQETANLRGESIAHLAFVPKWKLGKSGRIYLKKTFKNNEWKTLAYIRSRIYKPQ